MPKLNVLIVGLDTLACSEMGLHLLSHNVEVVRDVDMGFKIATGKNVDVVVTNNSSLTTSIRSFMSPPPIIILVKKWTAEFRPHGADLFVGSPIIANGRDIVDTLLEKRRKNLTVFKSA